MAKVAFVEGYYDSFAGAQQSLLYLLEHQTAVEPVLVTPRRGRVNEIAEERGIETAVVECPPALDVFEGGLLEGSPIDFARRGVAYLRYQVAFARYLGSAEVDVLYCNNPRSLLLVGLAAKLRRIPVIWYVRNDAKGGYSGPEWLDKVAVRLADHLLCISDGVRDRFENHRVDPSKFTTVNTGVDAGEFDPSREYAPIEGMPDEGTTIVEVASVHPRKGQDALVEAMGRVADDVGEFTLVLAGNVPDGAEDYRKRLEARASELGIAKNVVFTGWVEDVPALLSQADLFVLPSHNEGLPRSILEAFAMAVPVVATPAGGTEELVRDGETGYVVPLDDPEALGEAIERLCTDPELRTEMGRRARELVVAEYSLESYVGGFEAFFERTFGSAE